MYLKYLQTYNDIKNSRLQYRSKMTIDEYKKLQTLTSKYKSAVSKIKTRCLKIK